jgi:hypothetical protein
MSDEDVNDPPPGKSITPNEPLIVRAAFADPAIVNTATVVAKRLDFKVIAMAVQLRNFERNSGALKLRESGQTIVPYVPRGCFNL